MLIVLLASLVSTVVAAASIPLGPPPPQPVAQMPAGKSSVTQNGKLQLTIDPVVLGDRTNRVVSVIVDPTDTRVAIVQTRKLTWISPEGATTTCDLPAVPPQFVDDPGAQFAVDDRTNQLLLVRVATSLDLNQTIIDVIEANSCKLVDRHIVNDWLDVGTMQLVRDPTRHKVAVAATRRDFQLCVHTLDGELIWISGVAKGAHRLLGVIKGLKQGEELLVASVHHRNSVTLTVIDSSGAEQFSREFPPLTTLQPKPDDIALGTLQRSRPRDRVQFALSQGQERSRLSLRVLDGKFDTSPMPFDGESIGAELWLSHQPIRKAHVSAVAALPIVVQGQRGAGHPDPQVVIRASVGIDADDTVVYLQLPAPSGGNSVRIGRTDAMNWLLLWAHGSAFRVAVTEREHDH